MGAFVQTTGNRPDSARLALLSALTLSSPLLNSKVIGRALAVDAERTRILLEYDGAAVLVDLSLVLGASRFASKGPAFSATPDRLPRLRDIVMIIGDLEGRESDDRDIPSLGVPYPSPTLDSRVIVRALMMMPTKDDTDLNLREWAEACALSV